MKIKNLCEINLSNELEIALFGYDVVRNDVIPENTEFEKLVAKSYLPELMTGWKLIIYIGWHWPPIYFRGEWING